MRVSGYSVQEEFIPTGAEMTGTVETLVQSATFGSRIVGASGASCTGVDCFRVENTPKP
jgi:hypothetical protein